MFDQSPELRSPLGIDVLGDKVIVSQSPNIIVYTKDAGDHIVSKHVLLTGFKGVDHDHGVHAIVFGPDGRYYFNTGNEGWDVTGTDGTHVRMDPASYFQGAAFRMNPDGARLEVLAQNFRKLASGIRLVGSRAGKTEIIFRATEIAEAMQAAENQEKR